jgi:hypothetical protein
MSTNKNPALPGKLAEQRVPEPQEQVMTQSPVSGLPAVARRAKLNPDLLTAGNVLQLQRTIGNRAVVGLLAKSTGTLRRASREGDREAALKVTTTPGMEAGARGTWQRDVKTGADLESGGEEHLAVEMEEGASDEKPMESVQAGDLVILDGDKVIFSPVFGAATVVVQPGTMTGAGPARFDGKMLCVDGDEQSVAVMGCTYMTAQYSIPGTGTLKIAALGANQRASNTRTGGKAVILKGGQFTAKFEVQAPAQQPPTGPGSPVPDPTPQYSGYGMFQTTNTKFRRT